MRVSAGKAWATLHDGAACLRGPRVAVARGRGGHVKKTRTYPKYYADSATGQPLDGG